MHTTFAFIVSATGQARALETQELNYYFSGPELVEAETLSVPIKLKL